MNEVKYIEGTDFCGYPIVNLKIEDINIGIESNEKDSLEHIAEDYEVIIKYGIEKYIMNEFIPWLKGTDFLNKDNQKIYEGLKLYEVTYYYGKICAQYSPTKEDGFFGQFELSFEAGNDYTTDMLEADACGILVKDGKVYKGVNYDI